MKAHNLNPERRRPDRLDDRELSVEVLPNRAGGVMVKVAHLPSKKFVTSTHRNAEVARATAHEQLRRLVARASWRSRKARSRE